MKKLFTSLTLVLVVLSLFVGCGGGNSSTNKNYTKNTYEDGRLYNAFTLATSLTVAFDGYVNWHSSQIVPFGTGTSSNSPRFVNAENDRLLEVMRSSNPVTGADEYQQAYLDWVKLMNDELPLIPLYANDYHDLYNAKVQNFNTGPMWGWAWAIVEASGVDTFVAGNTSFNGEFLQGWGNSAYDENIRRLVTGGGLLTYGYEGEMAENYMVESMTVSEDQTTWNFKLKEGIVFSDGEELTTADVLFTYLFYSDPSFLASGGSAAYTAGPEQIEGYDDYVASCESGECDVAAFTGINVISDYEIEFTVPNPIYTTWTTVFSPYIMAEHYYAPDGVIDAEMVKNQLISKPLGSGPYKLVEYLEGQYVKLEINEYFPGNINGYQPTIQTVIAKVVPTETDIEQLIAGEVDLLAGMTQADRIDAAKATDGLTYNNYVRHGYGHLSFHTDLGPSQYKEFRQAVAYALDRAGFCEDFSGEYALVIDGPYSTNYWMISDEWAEENLTHYDYNPEKAKEILEANGWELNSEGIYEKDGWKAIVSIAAGSQDWADSLNLVTNKSVEESGIYFDVQSIDFAVLLEHYYGSYKGS